MHQFTTSIAASVAAFLGGLVLSSQLALAHTGLSPQAWAYSCETGQELMYHLPLCFSFTFTKGPYLNARGERRFSEGLAEFHSVQSAQGPLLTPEEVAEIISTPHFYLWMKMPGDVEHGARPVAVEQVSPSQFLISEVLMGKMPGQWFMRVQLDSSEPQSYQVEFPLTEWMSSM